MGRLENLLPHIKPVQTETTLHGYRATFRDSGQQVELTPLLNTFIEMSKGTFSLRELCVFLYDKYQTFSFLEIYRALDEWSKLGLFKNSEEIRHALEHQKDATKAPPIHKNLSKDELVAHLRRVGLFANLAPETLKAIAAASDQKTYAAGEMIIKKDTMGEEFFVLLSGSVGVFASFYMLGKSQPLAVLPPFSVFGESAVINNKKRTADVVGMTESQVVRVNIKKFSDPAKNQDLNKNIQVRLVFNQLLKLHPIFRNLPGEVLQMLLGSCRVDQIDAHQTVVQQGEKGQNFYFILSGAVQVIKDRLPELRLGIGSYFGEVGVLHKQARTASVVTETDCVFLVLSEKNFVHFLASNLSLAVEIEKEIANRGKQPVREFSSNEDTEVTEEITNNLEIIKDYDFSELSKTNE